MKTVTIYTDGACSGNPGPGGWCAILEYNGHEKLISGGEERTTNNRMELTAVIQALLALREPCVVELYSDSKYVIDALEKGWAWGWRKKGWVKSDKKPALNPRPLGIAPRPREPARDALSLGQGPRGKRKKTTAATSRRFWRAGNSKHEDAPPVTVFQICR